MVRIAKVLFSPRRYEGFGVKIIPHFVLFVSTFENTALRVDRFLPSPFPLPLPPKADQPQPNYPGLMHPSADSAEAGEGKKRLVAPCLEKSPRPFRWERARVRAVSFSVGERKIMNHFVVNISLALIYATRS
jgi:hypothetical protein